MNRETVSDSGNDASSDSAWQRFRVRLMYTLPHHLLSAAMHTSTRIRARAWKNWQINWFIQRYRVDMDIAQRRSPEDFEHFNAFFTRALNAEARPVCMQPDAVACPADGAISACGPIDGDSIFQAKGQRFSLTQLLGGDQARAKEFIGGQFCTIYLSPRDYHRVHMPVAGTLREMVHVPGRLFSVNPLSARMVPGLFARNERVVSIFDGDAGPFAVVMVGAVFVGSIEQVWAGEVAPASTRSVTSTTYPAASSTASLHLDKGEEMGRFNMGSTVIVILPPSAVRWRSDLSPGTPVSLGEMIAVA
ncbi:MAG: phosphatidylserine decarboxylase [Hyphomicrobiaceae bacterium]|jgi:phosphatidylserine decarboxylase